MSSPQTKLVKLLIYAFSSERHCTAVDSNQKYQDLKTI